MEALGPVCLGVTQSAAGRSWHWRTGDEARVAEVARVSGLPDLLARVLAARDFDPAESARYFDATLRTHMPDPSVLLNLDTAAARVAQALSRGERACVYGDYDVDGGTSAAMMLRYFRALGRELRLYVPDRMREGYGPNAAAMKALAAEGIKLVITVDCGAQAIEALDAARTASMDVVIADHHLTGSVLPASVAMVNPNQPGDTSGLGQLCAAGVVFMLLAGVNRALRQSGWFAAQGISEPDLRPLLDLVGLATICDVVPLTGFNRVLVRQGLAAMTAGRNAGLTALMLAARIKPPLRASHFGWALGPRVNAGGRVGRSSLGAELLSTDDPELAQRLAEELDVLNRERQAIESETLKLALEDFEKRGAGQGLAAAAGEGWHAGVIGIVAGRLKDRADLPSAVFAIEGETARASLRSVQGVDIGRAVVAAKESGLLINGGGHPMAAALTVARGRVDETIAFLDAALAPQVAARTHRHVLAVDAVVAPGAVTEDMFELLERAGPYGAGNPEPVVAVAAAKVAFARVVGESHVSVALTGASGARMKAIAFRAAGRPLGAALMEHKGQALHLAGRLTLNEWNGARNVELQIEDAAKV